MVSRTRPTGARRGHVPHADKQALSGLVAAILINAFSSPSAASPPQRHQFWIASPHQSVMQRHLLEAVSPTPGEHMLEVGSDIGRYSLLIAERLAPAGVLHVTGRDDGILDRVWQKACRRGLENLVASHGDPLHVPIADNQIDGVLLATELGHISDASATWRELARVLRPGGRLVVGELIGAARRSASLQVRTGAEAAGMRFDRCTGTLHAHFLRFVAE